MDAYWKYQSEKEKKLYAIIDAFNPVSYTHLDVYKRQVLVRRVFELECHGVPK